LEGRIRRFIATVKPVAAHFGRDLESADLRYPNGYAIKLRGVTTGESAATDKDALSKKR
jgi:cell division protein FtsQ